ncbi:MHYT domain-containing protein [Actinoplanes xinjiangensis]|jgi:NO-binding membrane sensor protein with MHYT domain|uniref:NO-binding membrane sensor protein with MHYT domain n=1 Tax=Actinoplanes xinjiangensis TaxID=512350 RepID=A0A316FDL2_9ACTN|nr:MHYT domain-containing protein [Actinoplanes xinjiangensis]PWK46152.1 NO-binding membrane sensor protein with MHYT domain [Actinoplanes xinjiangensis]GIF40916.1 MHYT domain-containing signal sensor [Actinoplanes xinjiangensis]
MAQIHHFEYGALTPTVSYILSVLGSLLGLTSAVRLRSAKTGGERFWWLTLAAVAIGATGIWSMHFVAMMGFDVDGTPIRYDIGLTVASAIIALASVGLGLAIALLGNTGSKVRILIGGVLAGLGVAAMHYTGMAAMELRGQIHYAGREVIASIAIAVVAATVALWLTLVVTKPIAIFVSALVMGIAVNGMHFTGMMAMSVVPESQFGSVEGATAAGLLVPVGAAVVFAIIGMGYALVSAPTEEDRAAAEYLKARIDHRHSQGATPAPAPAPFGGQPAGQQPQQQQPQGRAGRTTLGDGSWTYRDRGRQ